MKIILGRQIEEVKKDSENENLLKNRNSDELNELNELDADDIYFHFNTIKNIKLGIQLVNRIYLNNSIVYDLEDTIVLNLFHSLIPSATATSIIFDKLENQDISNFNLIGYCDANNHIAVYNNNTEYLVLNIRNAVNYAPYDCYKFFYNYKVLSNCVLQHFKTENVTDMQDMFYNCNSLTSLDLSNFNTENVTDMQDMFYNCNSLTSLDLSNFNTANVTQMNHMFANCRSLTSLNVSNFNTEKVKNMESVFCNCISLTSINLSSFNTQNVKNMPNMFYGCKNLASIISNTFNTTALPTLFNIFPYCTSLVGGNGTTYNNSHITVEYARVDGENGLAGYFTAPAANK